MAVKITVYGEAKLEQIERARQELQRLEDQVRRNATGISGSLTRVGESLERTGASMVSTGTNLTKKLTVPLVAAGAVLTKFTQAAAEDEQQQRVLQNTIANTTKATEAQRAAVEDWITATQNATGVADSQLRPVLGVLTGATGDLTKAQQLSSLALDVAAARGIDAQSAADALAKAYTGNLGALSRLVPGIDAAAVASGDFTQVQAELARLTGGAAAAAADTAAGKMEIVKRRMEDATEAIGYGLLPVMETLADFIGNQIVPAVERFAAWFQALNPQLKQNVIIAAAVAAALGPLLFVAGHIVTTVGTLTKMLPILGRSFLAALGPIGIIAGLLALLVASSPELRELLGNTLRTLVEKLAPVFQSLVTALMPVVEMIGGALSEVVQTLVSSGVFDMLAEALLSIVTAALPLIDAIIGLLPPILALIEPIIGLLLPILGPVGEALGVALPIAVGILQAALSILIPVLETIISWVVGLYEGIGSLISFLTGEISLEEFIAEMMSIEGPFGDLMRWAVDLGVSIGKFVREAVANVTRFANDVRKNIGTAIDFFTSIPTRIGQALAGAATWLVKTGRDIVQGLRKGISDAWQNFLNWFNDTIDGMLGGIRDLLGISSPSRVFAEIGQNMGDGIRVGLDSTLSAVERAAQQVAAAAVVSASGTVAVGVQAAADGLTIDPFTATSAVITNGGTTVQVGPGAIQITIQGDANREEVRAGVEDALDALLTEVRSR